MCLAQSSQFAEKETGQGAETCPGPFNQQAEWAWRQVSAPHPVLLPLPQATHGTQRGYSCSVEGKGDQMWDHWPLDWEDYM